VVYNCQARQVKYFLNELDLILAGAALFFTTGLLFFDAQTILVKPEVPRPTGFTFLFKSSKNNLNQRSAKVWVPTEK
jgi:hypothetical protein